jgi:hypothetical protein
MMRVRSERLRLPEEEVGYKKGGRVKGKKKAKKPKKSRKATGKRRATGKRSRGEAMRYAPLGGALPTTGMSSTVFGAPQTPSYFRAIQPDQQYANIPAVLKGLVSSQEKLFKELSTRRQQEQTDKVYAKKVVEEERTSSPTPSPTVGFRPLQSLFPNTLDILLSPVSTPSPPPILTPVPQRIIPSSYTGPLSSAEAGEPYRGADESLPLQPVASGDQMFPSAAAQAASSSSSYHALNAQAPESIDDAVDRSSGIAGDIGLPPIERPPSPSKGATVPLQPGRTYKKPDVESDSKQEAPLVKQRPVPPMERLTADNVNKYIGRKVHFVSGGNPVKATIVSATASGINISGAPPDVAAATKNNLTFSRVLQVVKN